MLLLLLLRAINPTTQPQPSGPANQPASLVVLAAAGGLGALLAQDVELWGGRARGQLLRACMHAMESAAPSAQLRGRIIALTSWAESSFFQVSSGVLLMWIANVSRQRAGRGRLESSQRHRRRSHTLSAAQEKQRAAVPAAAFATCKSLDCRQSR